MEYKDFLKPFYCSSKSESRLKGITSQKAIARYFMEVPFNRVVPNEFIYSDDTYRKWFTGPNSPKASYWEAIEDVFKKKSFDETAYKMQLLSKLNDASIDDLAKAFGISVISEGHIDKGVFAEALTLQFMAFVDGKGISDNIIASKYYSKLKPCLFKDYIRKATAINNKMTLLGGEECLLEEAYVCNYLTTSPGVFRKNKRTIIENATLEKLRTFDKRGITNKILLVGGGGSGKTLMLQHFFVDSASHYIETGLLPIFLELREFSFSNDLFTSIVKIVHTMDESFTAEAAHQLLVSGKCQILLDGIDEIDQSDINNFQRALKEFLAKYTDNQIIMTSRDCGALHGIKGFIPIYLLPFDEKQSETLINKLIGYAPEVKRKIYDCIDKGFINKEGAFVSNPMMLTFVVEKYPKLDDFYKNRYLFYKSAYEAIVLEHDNDKTAYKRIFRSVENADEFTMVFSEFCAITYRQGVFQFDTATFDLYFKELNSKKQVLNSRILTAKNFLYDACSTACMMYEQDCDIFYIDPGFQEFMFAQYYALEDSNQMRALGKGLEYLDVEIFGNLNAFRMLYDYSSIKTEVCLFLPYLDCIFKDRTEDEAFLQYLNIGYKSLRYTVLNSVEMNKYNLRPEMLVQMRISTQNEPRSIILSVILNILKDCHIIRFVTQNIQTQFKELQKEVFTGEYVDSHFAGKEVKHILVRRNLYIGANKDVFEQTHDVTNCIKDEKNRAVFFGEEYEIKISLLIENREMYKELFSLFHEHSRELKAQFNRVKKYYVQIKERQFYNDFR